MTVSSAEEIYSTFRASVRSVGTAVAMACVGIYLHQRGFVSTEGKRTLAKISQQVTFPLFLFCKIIYCNQDWSNNPCPDVTRSLGDVWPLVFLPIYVVGIGLCVGGLVAYCTNAPLHHYRAVLAACSFGNSTGLPITLLTVVHTNFPVTSDLGRIDPTLFLSVYLLLYPVLQWGFGGWLLAPPKDSPADAVIVHTSGDNNSPLRHHVLNHPLAHKDTAKRHGLTSADEGMYMTETDLTRLLPGSRTTSWVGDSASNLSGGVHSSIAEVQCENTSTTPSDDNDYYLGSVADEEDEDEEEGVNPNEVVSFLALESKRDYGSAHQQQPSEEQKKLIEPTPSHRRQRRDSFDAESMWQSIANILDRCFQPPVIGAVAGILTAVTPLRGVFVDLVDRDDDAPLQWLFDGLYAVGQAAVPINMMILGCNLSASQQSSTAKTKSNSMLLNMNTMLGIVFGKMVLMPFIGILTGYTLKHYLWDIPSDIAASFYLVLMIVFLTPTANNVMVMVELSGSKVKEGIARVIALQYAVAPVILSLTMTIAIGVASDWS